jgi:hypothetical protein
VDLDAGGYREESVWRVVVGGQPPSGVPCRLLQWGLGQWFVGAQRAPVAGGEGGSSRRVEQDEETAGPGDSCELLEPRFGVWQVHDQAGREHHIDGSVTEGEVAGVGDDECGVRGVALGAGLDEHFGGQVERDNSALWADCLAQGRQRPPGAAAAPAPK